MDATPAHSKRARRAAAPPEWGLTSRADALHPSDVSTAEDRALELATRPRRGVPLTAEERAVRRRLQYKLHQRRHRAKQRATTAQLQRDVAAALGEIEALERRREALVHTTHSGAPVRIAMEYLRLFEHGLVDDVRQERFLRAVMAPNVAGPDYQGVDYMVDQWRLYRVFFPHIQFLFKGFEVIGNNHDVTVVVLDIELTVRSRRAGVLALYPGLRDDESVLQALLGEALRIPGKIRFVFDADGVCSWFGTEFDFVVGLQRALGSLKAVAKCLDSANISFATGQIHVKNQIRHNEDTPCEVDTRWEHTTLAPTEYPSRRPRTPSWTNEF